MGKRGPKPKAEGTRAVRISFSFTPEQKEQIEATIPKGERSRLVQVCLMREVKRRQKES